MNRNCRNNSNKTLNKNSRPQSSKLNKSLDSNRKSNPLTPTHFLNKPPQTVFDNKPFPNNQSKFNHHFASTTQLISTPFQTKAYVPPHLNSSQVFKCITSQCQNWQVRPSSASKKLNYNNMYKALQLRYQKAVPCGSRLKKWTVASKIKNMVYEDKTRFGFGKPYKLYMEQKSESEGEIDYMNDSEGVGTQQDQGNGNSSRMISIVNQSRLKVNKNMVQTQI